MVEPSSPPPPQPDVDVALVKHLVEVSRQFDASSGDPQRNCWLAVHQHVHGVLPSEYDIRNVPEALVLAVLEERGRQP